MRQFKTLCKDTKTGYEMILSEVSYNAATAFLSGKPEVGEYIGMVKDGSLIKLIFKNRNFYYDEDRGYLLGE